MTSSGTPAAPTTYTYNPLGQRTLATTTPTSGNPLTTTYAYDAAGRLTTATPPGGASDTYTYDGDGLRATAAHTTGTTDTFLWDVAGNLPLLLHDATNTYLYGLGSSPYAQINRTTGAITYLHADNLGSTRTTTDTTGATTGTWTYDLYGNTTNHTGTTTTPFLYAGQYRDATTGLYYLRARYYDPATAQFLTRDPLQALTRQPYTYTSGNPLQTSDPTGLLTCDDLSGLCNSPAFFWNEVVGVGKGAIATGDALIHPVRTYQQIVDACNAGFDQWSGGTGATVDGFAQCIDNINPIAGIRRNLSNSLNTNCIADSGQQFGQGLFSAGMMAAPFAKGTGLPGGGGGLRAWWDNKVATADDTGSANFFAKPGETADSTPQGRRYSNHFMYRQGEAANHQVPGDVIDGVIDYNKGVEDPETGYYVFYDKRVNVTVVREPGVFGQIMSAHYGRP